MGTRVAFKTASESFPKQGNRELPVLLDFTNTGVINDSLFSEMQGQIETIQCVYIDNSANFSTLSLKFRKTQQVILAQPLTQGIYPVIEPGAIEYQATTSQGQTVPIIFSNTAKDFNVWGPVPGANIVPALANAPLNFAPLGIGDNVIVAGVANQTVKVYRLFYTLGAGSTLSLQDTAGNRWTGDMNTFAGGGAAFQASGVPWFVGALGAGIKMVSSAGVNMGGQIGYVQS